MRDLIYQNGKQGKSRQPDEDISNRFGHVREFTMRLFIPPILYYKARMVFVTFRTCQTCEVVNCCPAIIFLRCFLQILPLN